VVAVIGPEHLVLDHGVGDRSAEVVLGLDRRFDRIAQGDRLLGRFDGHFELRLLVFLDPEAAAAVLLDRDAVDAQRAILGRK